MPGIDGEILELGAEIATNDGMAELKRVMDAFQPLDTPAYQRVLAERPDYQEFNDRKWESLSAVMWATLARAIRDQPDQLADLAALTVPTLVMVGEQDEPFLAPSRRTAATIPGAQLVVIPDAGHSPQFENPRRGTTRSCGSSTRSCASRRQLDRRGGVGGGRPRLRRQARGRRPAPRTTSTPSSRSRAATSSRFFDGCVQDEIALVDTRHEQTATFAAEGWAKVTRRVGVCALTAGPGVTNGVSALTAAQMTGSPMLAIGGRAPAERWGSGSLQELDPLPILGSVVKHAATAPTTEAIPATFDAALRGRDDAAPGTRLRRRPARRLRERGDGRAAGRAGAGRPRAAPTRIPTPWPGSPRSSARRAHPVVIAGGDVYWDRAEVPLRAWAEAARVPVFANGMGRGTLPADHELRLRAGPVARAARGGPRAGRGHAARLPARVRGLRRRAGRAPLRRAGPRRRARAARRVDRG